jgi:glycosyltransferase involved in cell wall biosynthesis
LQGLSQAGCDLHLISSEYEQIPGVKLHHLPIYSAKLWRQIKYTKRINQCLKEIDPDIIHLFGLFSVSSLGAMFTVKGKKNLIITFWGSDIIPGDKKDTLKSKIIKKYIINQGKRFVVISEYLAIEAKKYANKSISVNVIPWGINPDDFFQLKIRPTSDVIKIGYAKKLEEIYGPDTLLKAFAKAIDKTSKDIILRIAGNGSLEKKLKIMAKRLGVDNRIEWLGWINSIDELREFYNSLDIFIMPSRREAFGMAALEASAMELPVIASNCGGIPEVVISGENGLLVETDDVDGFQRAMTELIENDKKRKAMGKRGKEIARQKYNRHDSIPKMIDIYNETLNA